MAFVGFLAGELGSGGGCNSSFRIPSIPTPPPHRDPGTEQFVASGLPPQLAQHPGTIIGLILLGIAVGFGLLILFMYISSVMRFILFDSVIEKECRIRQGWIRRRSNGRKLLVWQIWLMLITFAGLIVLVGVPLAFAGVLGLFKEPKEHLAPLILGGVLLFLLLLVFMLALAVVYVLTKDFVVPQMALEGISAKEGWRRLWLWMKADKGGYLGYIGMKIVLAVGAGIVFGIIILVVFLVLLIPIGGVGALAVFGGMAAGLTWNFYTIALAVVAGVIALAVILFVVSFISVPAIVFFPAYSIYFFAARYPALAALIWPQAPSSVAPSSPPQEPPPLPPAPAPAG